MKQLSLHRSWRRSQTANLARFQHSSPEYSFLDGGLSRRKHAFLSYCPHFSTAARLTWTGKKAEHRPCTQSIIGFTDLLYDLITRACHSTRQYTRGLLKNNQFKFLHAKQCIATNSSQAHVSDFSCNRINVNHRRKSISQCLLRLGSFHYFRIIPTAALKMVFCLQVRNNAACHDDCIQNRIIILLLCNCKRSDDNDTTWQPMIIPEVKELIQSCE